MVFRGYKKLGHTLYYAKCISKLDKLVGNLKEKNLTARILIEDEEKKKLLDDGFEYRYRCEHLTTCNFKRRRKGINYCTFNLLKKTIKREL